MGQPTPFNRLNNFTDPVSAVDLNAEVDAVELTLDGLTRNIALIQRDDGALANTSVHPESLAPVVLGLMSAGLVARGDWLTGTAYAVHNAVIQSGQLYVAIVAHVAGTFVNDLNAAKWMLFSWHNLFSQSTDYPAGTVGAKLQETVSVTDAPFNADPTGVADSTAAFLAAISFLASTGGTIEIPIGTYKITQQLLVSGKTGVRFRGASKDGCVIVKTFVGSALLRFLNANHFEVDSVCFQGVLDASGTDKLIHVDGSSYGRIANCKIFNGAGYGVSIEQASGAGGAYFNILEGNHFFNNGRRMPGVTGANIYCGAESSETKVIGGECQSSIGAGWLIEGGNGHTGLGASFEGNAQYGLKIGTVGVAPDVNLFGCRFEGAGIMQYGIHITNAVTNVGIFGCQLTSNVIGDVYDPDVARVHWSGNSISTSPAAYRAVGVKVIAGTSPGFNWASGTVVIQTGTGSVPELSGAGPLRIKAGTDLELGSVNGVVYLNNPINKFNWQAFTGVVWEVNSGSPENVVTAGVGSLYTRTNGGAGTTLYVKESGTGNTGWIAK
jgi:hypothetical protein